MQNWQQERQWYAAQALTTRQTWYADVAGTYDRVRPRYPTRLIAGAIAAAGLPRGAQVCEIGCGPGILTLPLVESGLQVSAIEPNPEFFALMQRKCANFPSIQLINAPFETWDAAGVLFDAVIAANAWHWLDPAIAPAKAAQILKLTGHLIVFWHLKPEPKPEIFQLLRSAYQEVPNWFAYEGQDQQQAIAKNLGQELIDSGYFQDLQMQIIPWSQIYSTADYLALLSTFSPYLRLAQAERDRVFSRLNVIIETELAGQIELFNWCVCHMVKPLSSYSEEKEG